MCDPRGERLAEFHSKEMIASGMGDMNDFRLQIARALGNGGSCSQWGTGDLERNLRQRPQRAVYGNQGSASGNIHRRGKFEEVFAVFTVTAYENRNGQRKTVTRTSFHFRLLAIQTVTPLYLFWPVFPHLWGQTNDTN